MAGQSKRASRTSNGGRKKAHLAQEAKRQAKFVAKREAGKAYEYHKNPYKEGTSEYYAEQYDRMTKNKSHKTDIAQFRSIMQKLENRIRAEQQAAKVKGRPKKERKEE